MKVVKYHTPLNLVRGLALRLDNGLEARVFPSQRGRYGFEVAGKVLYCNDYAIEHFPFEYDMKERRTEVLALLVAGSDFEGRVRRYSTRFDRAPVL